MYSRHSHDMQPCCTSQVNVQKRRQWLGLSLSDLLSLGAGQMLTLKRAWYEMRYLLRICCCSTSWLPAEQPFVTHVSTPEAFCMRLTIALWHSWCRVRVASDRTNGRVHGLLSLNVLHGIAVRADSMHIGVLECSPMVASMGTLAIRGCIRRSHASLHSHLAAQVALLA